MIISLYIYHLFGVRKIQVDIGHFQNKFFNKCTLENYVYWNIFGLYQVFCVIGLAKTALLD